MLKHPDQIKMSEISKLCNFKVNNPIGNYLGIMGEVSELVQAALEGNKAEYEDAITDIYVFLLNLSNDLDINLPIAEHIKLDFPNTENFETLFNRKGQEYFASLSIHSGNLGSLLGKHTGYIKTKPSDASRDFHKEIEDCLLVTYLSLFNLSSLCGLDLSTMLDKVINILKERHIAKTEKGQ